MINITPAQLRKAADIQEKIQSLQSDLNEILGGKLSTPAETDATEAPKRRKVSAAGRARMQAAQIARWAKIKGTAPATSDEPAQKPKKKQLTEAKLKALAKARAARWAKASDKAAQEKPKKKRKMTEAWRNALARAHAARRAKGKAAAASKP